MKNLKFPCYVQVVSDLVNGVQTKKEMYPEFEQRGENDFAAWNAYAKMALHLVRTYKPNLNAQKEFAKAIMDYCQRPCDETYHPLFEPAEKLGIENPLGAISDFDHAAAEYEIPNYRLFPEEYEVILRAEQYGRGKQGTILSYGDRFGSHEVISVDYRNIPANKGGLQDVVVVYSGHQQTGHKATELVYNYIRKHRKFPEYLINLGYEDNQNMTDFNPAFKLRKHSEADTYANEEEAMGLPKEWIRELWIQPEDTDTRQNIGVIGSLQRRFGISACNLIIIGYPVYQLRTAAEFAWGLGQIPDSPYCNIIIADIPTKTKGVARMWDVDNKEYDDYRILSYDQPLYQLGDLSLANCCAHLHFRTSGDDQVRYAIPGLAPYPEEFKKLAPMFLAYSYPNVISGLFGSEGEEKDKVEEMAKVMKILRYLQLCKYDKGMSGAAMDEQEKFYVHHTIKKMQSDWLTGRAIIDETKYMKKQEALECILAFQDLLAAE